MKTRKPHKWCNAVPKPEVMHPDYPLLPDGIHEDVLKQLIYKDMLRARQLAFKCGVKTPVVERFHIKVKT